jgi:acyl carrier protein
MTTNDRIVMVIGRIFENRGELAPPIHRESVLYGEGIGLDSMDAATLSALLEQEFGHDPYTTGKFPRTVGDILSYYQADDLASKT